MKKHVVLLIVSLLLSKGVFGQYCPNANFSLHNFDNWKAYTGYNSGGGVGCCPTPGIVAGRHTIITTQQSDPRTNGGLIVPAPGQSVCAKLGNEINGAEAERLVYYFTVDPDNPNFIYRYAVVFQDPGHPEEFQPFFSIKVLNDQDQLVDTACGFYQVYSSAGIPGFQTWTSPTDGLIHWKDWTTVGVNLAAYAGQLLHIEFTNLDCAWGGHYGYAYLTAECGRLNIDESYCNGSDSAILSAPIGFSYLWNTGDTTQNITVPNPLIGTLYSCNVTSVTGCNFILSATISRTVLHPAFVSQYDSCSRTVIFTDSSWINNSSIYSWNWSFGDGTFSTEQNPVHEYTSHGSYPVTLTISTSGGCDSSYTEVVNIGHVAYANYTAGDTCLLAGVVFHNNSAPADSLTDWFWDYGDSSPIDHTWDTTHFYSAPGSYTVSLYLTNYNGCTDTSIQQINVYSLPNAAFTIDPYICVGEGAGDTCLLAGVVFHNNSAP
ncbi:MAG: PKD domain-containing protein, partial [Bacteroidota bacterium]